MQRHDICCAQQGIQAFGRGHIAMLQLVDHVEINDPHAHGFGKVGKLCADVAVADDAERLAADFVGSGRTFQPAALMRRHGLGKNAAQQHDDLRNRQLGDGSCVGKGRIENRNTAHERGFQFHLVGADGKTTYGDQASGSFKHLFGDLSAGADAQHLHVVQPLDQCILFKRTRQDFHIRVAGFFKNSVRGWGNAFQQEPANLIFRPGETVDHGPGAFSSNEMMLAPDGRGSPVSYTR